MAAGGGADRHGNRRISHIWGPCGSHWRIRRKIVGAQSIGEIIGPAYVIDGDTIEIQGVCIRFYGIDAPETSQQCSDATGAEYSCGQETTTALDNLVRGQTVRCDQRDTDKYGRAVAICTANGTDLNAALVEAGLAVAYGTRRRRSGAARCERRSRPAEFSGRALFRRIRPE